MENEFKNITLYDEMGEEMEFQVITKLEIENKEYFIVTPIDSEEGEAVALKVEKDDNGEEVLVTVEDEEEFNIVAEAYEILFSSEE